MTADRIADLFAALSQAWGELLSTHPVLVTLLLGGCVLWCINRR